MNSMIFLQVKTISNANTNFSVLHCLVLLVFIIVIFLLDLVNHNGEYEPSREEAEELERALAAVDNDVKSLQKLSQSHGLLDTFLDEQNLVESLVQIPDMFHNGYVPCGDSMVAHSSRLLPVEPHSHS